VNNGEAWRGKGRLSPARITMLILADVEITASTVPSSYFPGHRGDPRQVADQSAPRFAFSRQWGIASERLMNSCKHSCTNRARELLCQNTGCAAVPRGLSFATGARDAETCQLTAAASARVWGLYSPWW